MTVPLSFLRYQAPNIVGMFGNGLRSVLPRAVGGRTPDSAPLRRRLDPVPPALVEAYAEWTGAPRDRYRDELPPHLFSYWALGLIADLTGRVPYNVLSIVNQGCRMVVRRPLPADEPLDVIGRLGEIVDDGRRIRIATHLEIGTDSAPDAQSVDVLTAVPHRNPKRPRSAAPREPARTFETVGTWSAAAGDGRAFALLTGDFNPLHTLELVARRTRYNGCILHGFGLLSRTYETLRNAGVDIAVFDVRYVKPVPLPSDELAVSLAREADTDGSRALRLESPDGTLHMAGHLHEKEPA